MRLSAGLAALMLAFFDGLAAAQGLPVRSGEHDGFTRLVAPIGPDRDWQIVRDEAGVAIRFSPDAPEFDVSRVFDLIGRTRLTAIRSEDGLYLSLACPCTVSVERYQGNLAVIDISDSPFEPNVSPQIEPVVEIPPEPAATLPVFADARTAPAMPDLALPHPPLDSPQCRMLAYPELT